MLFSGKLKSDIIDEGYFKFLQTKFRNFKFKYTLTGENNPGGLEGRITEILPELYPDLSNYSIYIAGGPDFVTDVTAKVKELGAKEDLIHLESFFDQQ